MDTIDLRSDTVTHPTPEMREAMAHAIVGDDVYGEDPTVNQLEAEAAYMLGKEAGLFVTSGSMGNLVAIMTHCDGRTDEIIVGNKAHIFRYEAGSASTIGGVHVHTILNQPDGTLRLEDIRTAIREDDPHFPRTKLICLENTQGTIGGVAIPKSYIDAVGAIAKEHNLKLHIDGARIFNAATELDTPVHELVASADSVTFCLSKGLCAPVGSVLVGSRAFIDEARRIRKVLGGGMRQAGILAAAGLISLRMMTKRLHEDHATARAIGEGIQRIAGIHVKSIHTNFVFFELLPDAKLSPQKLIDTLDAEYRIKLALYPGYTHTFRIVTHYWVTPERAQVVIRALRTVLS
ncbi:MAG: low-specificity L-threonine aldolase [Phototrophicales bacterium]|nr:MAG: low-specificity L-threonine aldolase [Phototrophicales bacterium]